MSLGLGHTPHVKSLGDFLFYGPSRITPPTFSYFRNEGKLSRLSKQTFYVGQLMIHTRPSLGL